MERKFNKPSPLLVLIVGPTAVGKTQLTFDLAKHFKAEIISADSRQFYKSMDIGTSIPSKKMRDEVKHHFIQHLDLNEKYSAGKFEQEVSAFLRHHFKSNTLVFMTGGSFLYVDALIYGLENTPSVDHDYRAYLNSQYNKFGIAYLQQQLRDKDIHSYNKIDIHNPRRLTRALELIKSKLDAPAVSKEKRLPKNYNILKLGLSCDRTTLYKRIDNRVDMMIADGLIQEAKKLYPLNNELVSKTIGYPELFEYFKGKISLEKAIEAIKTHSRRYAKRQLTWLQKYTDFDWYDLEDPFEKMAHQISKTIKKK